MSSYTVNDVTVCDNAHAQFGDIYNSNHVKIDVNIAPLTDYIGTYANNPLIPVSTYVDRPILRQKLEAQLHDCIDNIHEKTQISVIHGIGGVGKTQIVLNYIQRHRKDYSAVFWVEATTPKTIERDFLQIYLLLYNIQTQHGLQPIKLQHAVPAVKRWFYGRERKFLFVFDNADTINDEDDPCYVDLRYFLPDDPGIHVLVTSRDRSVFDITELQPIEVGEMLQDEAVLLFKNQTKPTTLSSQQEENITSIVQELGCLALAITLAGSYVASTPRLRADLACYLKEYRDRRKVLLAQRPSRLIHQYGASVLTTWETTHQTIERQNPDACHFLAFLSFLDHNDLPADLPTSWDKGEPCAWISALFPDRAISDYDVEDIFRLLTKFSMIKYQEARHAYQMHSLVQAWAYDRLDISQQRWYAYAELLLIQAMVEGAKRANPGIRARTIPHVVTSCNKVFQCLKTAPVEHISVLQLLPVMADFLDTCGQYQDAVTVRAFILEKYTSWYGQDAQETLRATNKYTNSLRNSGKLSDAVSIQRSLVAKLGAIEDADQIALACMADFALCLTELGHAQEALPMQKALLARQRQVLGDDHPECIVLEHNLTLTLREIGHEREAHSILMVSIEKYKQILGNDHPTTLALMQNAGISLRDFGQMQESESMIRAVLARLKEAWGDDHPNTLYTKALLSTMLTNSGRVEEALALQREALSKQQKILGDDHPDTLASLNNLSYMLSQMGQLDEAIAINRLVLSKLQQLYGDDHGLTLEAMNDMGCKLIMAGYSHEALPYLRTVVGIRKKLSGLHHPDTLVAMSNLGCLLNRREEHHEALSVHQVVLEKREQSLGRDHEDTLQSLKNVGMSLLYTGEYEKGLTAYREAAGRIFDVLGNDHPLSITITSELASIERCYAEVSTDKASTNTRTNTN